VSAGLPVGQSIDSTDAASFADVTSFAAVRNIAGTYDGSGNDNVFGKSAYVITFAQSKSSLIGLLTWGTPSDFLQTRIKGSVTAHGYTVNATGTRSGAPAKP